MACDSPSTSVCASTHVGDKRVMHSRDNHTCFRMSYSSAPDDSNFEIRSICASASRWYDAISFLVLSSAHLSSNHTKVSKNTERCTYSRRQRRYEAVLQGPPCSRDFTMAAPTTAMPGTSAGAFGYAAAASRIQEGSYTVVIYGLIRCEEMWRRSYAGAFCESRFFGPLCKCMRILLAVTFLVAFS